MQSSLSEYFKVKKRLRDSDGSSGIEAKKLKAVSSESKLSAPVKKTTLSTKPGTSKSAKHQDAKPVEETSNKTTVPVKAPVTSEQMRQLLKNKGKLADLQAALGRFNNCSKQLQDFRNSVKDQNEKALLQAEQERRNKIKGSPKKKALLLSSPSRLAKFNPAVSATQSPGITPDKFYSPSKNRNENIFASPTKLTAADIRSPAKSPFKSVAVRKLFPSALDEPRVSLSSEVDSDSQNEIPVQKKFHLIQKPETSVSSSSPTKAAPPVDPKLINCPLPFKFKVLEEQFNAMESIVSILHNRKELITFSKVKAAVQIQVRRTGFKERQLGQILTVFPDAYQLSIDKVKGHGSSKLVQELVITLNLEAEEKMTAALMTSRRRTFHDRLLNICHEHHKTYLANLKPAIVIPEGSKVTRWHPRFRVEEIPSIEMHPIPTPVDEKVPTANDVFTKAQHIISNANPRMKRAMEDLVKKKLADDAVDKMKKTKNVSEKPAEAKSGTVDTEKGKDGSTENRIENLKAKISKNKKLQGISLSLLEKIRAREQSKALVAMTLSPEDQKRVKMMHKLPDMVKIIKNIFVAEKKTALALETVVERISHSNHGVLTAGEVEEHVRLLSSVLPEWMTIHNLSQGFYVKIQKQMDINQLLDNLQVAIQKTA